MEAEFPSAPRAPKEVWQPTRRALAAAFALVVILASGGGFLYDREQRASLRESTLASFDAVSRPVTSAVSLWRRERLGDALILCRRAALATELVRHARAPHDATTQHEPLLDDYEHYAQYDRAFAFDARGRLIATGIGPAEVPSAQIVRRIEAAARARRPELVDFYLDERDGRPHLALIAPLEDEASGELVVVALRIDPAVFLYPLIAQKTGLVASGETVLVRPDGDAVQLLSNTLRDRGAALRRRVPMARADALLARAITGPHGLVEGEDDDGARPLLGVVRPVDDSEWHLVTRCQRAEIDARARRGARAVAAFVALAILAVGGAIELVARVQRGRFDRAQGDWALALREQHERLRLAMRAASLGLWDFNHKTLDYVVSAEYATMLGYDPASFRETARDFLARLHPDDAQLPSAEMRAVIARGADDFAMEFRLKTRDGAWRWIHSNGRIIARDASGAPVRSIGVHLDVTERKEAELRQRRLAGLYAALSHCNEAIVRSANEAELFPRVCEAAVQYGGITLAWIGLIDGDGRGVRPSARAGEGGEFVDALWVPLDVSDPRSLGPTSKAVREGRPVWVTDADTSPITDPWKDLAQSLRWRAGAAFPIRRGEAVVGVLALYARDPDVFDDEGRALLADLANDVSYALDNFAREVRKSEAERALRVSLREQEALLKEVHHRVKNNLQVISSLLNLEGGRATDAGVRATLGDMQRRVLTMAQLHETLYRSEDLARVDLGAYLGEVARGVARVHSDAGRAALTLDLAAAHVDIDQAIPCGLLANELLSNAYKYAFPAERTGTIRVALTREGDALRLVVSDDGVGLPDDFDLRRTRSLGLQLVSDLARQLRASLTLSRAPGTTFTLTFTPRAPTPSTGTASS